jgi:hypothetical protein
VDRRLVGSHAVADGGYFSVQRRTLDAGAGPGPVRRIAALQGKADRRRRRGVGDPHLAQRQQLDAVLDSHHTVGNGARAVVLAHRRASGEVFGRLIERHLVDPQIGIGHGRQLVDRTAAGDEVLHHLRRHIGRIGRDSARRDAMIAGKNADPRAVGARRVTALPQAHPAGDFLQPAERSGGLGQLALAGVGGRTGLEVRSR